MIQCDTSACLHPMRKALKNDGRNHWPELEEDNYGRSACSNMLSCLLFFYNFKSALSFCFLFISLFLKGTDSTELLYLSLYWTWPLYSGVTICWCFPNENRDGVLKGEQSEAEQGHLLLFFSAWTDPLTGWWLANKRLVCRQTITENVTLSQETP